jgi:ubiquinone/menaquinone biosynthesis C-methylase UbiE
MGFDVVGIDSSKESIDLAQRMSAERGLTTQYLVGDMRNISDLQFTQEFDLVICIGNTIAYMMTDVDLTMALREMYDSLVDSGIVLADNRNFQKILCNWERDRYVYHGIIEEAGNRYVVVNVRDKGPGQDQMTFNFIKVPITGNSEQIESLSTVYRTLTKDELLGSLRKVGFNHIRIFGGWNLQPYDEFADNMMYVLGEKRKETA